MKIYSRNDASFQATLLTPPVDDVLVRLMSPQDRGRLMIREVPSAELLSKAIAEVVANFDFDSVFDAKAAKAAFAAYREELKEEIGKYANYPADFNYLAHALGSTSTRYMDWFHDLGGLHLTPGVTAVFADTGVGKTTMADLLTFNMLEQFEGDTTKILRVKLGESGSDLETFLRFSELAEALPAALPPMIVIDSVRLQTFDMGGASRSLSISNQLFRWLTEIDIFAVGHGIAVVLVMNPLGGEKDKIDQFRSDVESSVMSVVNLTSWNEGTFKHRGDKNGRIETKFVIPGEIERNQSAASLATTPAASAAVAPLVLKGSTSNFTSGGRTTYGRTRVSKP